MEQKFNNFFFHIIGLYCGVWYLPHKDGKNKKTILTITYPPNQTSQNLQVKRYYIKIG